MALLPLVTFILIYLVISIVVGDFYKVPITVAFLISSIVAIATFHKDKEGRTIPLPDRIKVFSLGAASHSMMLMLWIFILAGAFASSAKAMGSIDATVNMALEFLPAQMIMAGIFVATCFVSLSVGTSCGTIAALVPIAVGLSTQLGVPVPFMVAVVVGGSFFGDNLSFISDTTIVATQSQGCKMSDKFRENIRIVAPAAILVLAIYVIMGMGMNVYPQNGNWNLLLVCPYLAVLIAAIYGMNVMLVLTMGCMLTGIIGIATGAYDVFGWMQSMADGILGMGELIIVTMLAGGMLEVVKANGGIDLIINAITKHINSRKGGEFSISILTILVDFCTANNTVAIITTGPIARQIAERFSISPRRTASLLDTSSCFAQGVIPYGAQLLIASGLASVSPVAIIPGLYYPFALGIATVTAIMFYSKKKIDATSNNRT